MRIGHWGRFSLSRVNRRNLFLELSGVGMRRSEKDHSASFLVEFLTNLVGYRVGDQKNCEGRLAGWRCPACQAFHEGPLLAAPRHLMN